MADIITKSMPFNIQKVKNYKDKTWACLGNEHEKCKFPDRCGCVCHKS